LKFNKDYEAMINFCVKRSRVCHAYRINHSIEFVETWHVDAVTIVRMPFCGLKGIEKKTMEI